MYHLPTPLGPDGLESKKDVKERDFSEVQKTEETYLTTYVSLSLKRKRTRPEVTPVPSLSRSNRGTG